MVGCVTRPSGEEGESVELALEAGAADQASPDAASADGDADPGETGAADAHADADAEAGAIVILYDTYAQALYFDGTYGPTTGIIRAVDMGAGVDKVYEFWHGHNGIQHRFTLTAAHFATLRQKKRVNLLTTVVDDHQHQLFVDPVGATWRVPGAPPVAVPA